MDEGFSGHRAGDDDGMHVLMFAAGAVLVLGALTDAVVTTLSVGSGAGRLTAITSRATWRTALRMHRQRSRHRMLRFTGVVILLQTFAQWALLTWAGWSLVYSSASGAVVVGDSGEPAAFLERVYFTGQAMLTLGNGDFVAGDTAWRLLLVLAVLSGLFVVTLTLSYLVSVVQAVTNRRQFAARVVSLGANPAEIVVRAWDGERFSHGFSEQVVAVTGELSLLTEQHLAYPVLHFFGSGTRATSGAAAIALFDDMLTLTTAAIPAEHRPDRFVVEPAQVVVRQFLETLRPLNVRVLHGGVPPAPSLDLLRRAGVPTVDDEDYAAVIGKVDDRRTDLHDLVRSEGWEWAEAEWSGDQLDSGDDPKVDPAGES